MNLSEWAARWGVHPDAMEDLARTVLNLCPPPAAAPGISEAAVQAAVRVEASRLGRRVFRNNLGVTQDHDTGSFVRYGLANDSASVNAVLKSADLIGIAPRIIQPQDVGLLFGQFVSYEVKHAGWKYTGTEREVAQLAWATLVQSLGGDARFVTGPGQI